MAWVLDGTTGDRITTTRVGSLTIDTTCAISACGWQYAAVTNASKSPFCITNDSTVQFELLRRATTANLNAFGYGTGALFTNIAIPEDGTWYFWAFDIAGTAIGSANLRVWTPADGWVTNSNSTALQAVTAPSVLSIGGGRSGTGESWSGKEMAVKVWNAVLSADEFERERLSLYPRRVKDLHSCLLGIGQGAASALRDMCGPGWTLTGTITYDDSHPSYVSGGLPIWIVDHPAGGAGDVTVSVPSISLTLSANAPTVVTTANKVVDVPKGTLSLTSFVPSVAVSDHKLVNVPQGSLLLFGLAPTVAATAHVTVSVPADALSLSTFVPTVTATGNVLISVPLATLSLAATAPLVLTGASQIVQVPKGTLTLAAEAPTVATTANQVVSVPKADLTLTSYEPSVVATANQKVDVPAASLELTGYAPTVSADGGTIVSVPFSSLELTLHAPTIVTPRVVSIPEAVLELVAYAPTIITPRLIDVPSTSLTLTSFAPEVHTTAVIEVPATSLTITGYAPSVDAGSGGGVASTRVTWG